MRATWPSCCVERYPHTRLILMGESMGAAVLMCLAASADPPPADGYVLVAPAVWGRAEMNVFLRAALWLVANAVPGLTTTGSIAARVASDNREAIRRLSTDPLTIHETRFDTIRGLVDLMDAALAAAPHFHGRALFMYGGKDELIPDRATAATWRALPPGPVRAFYPADYHLLLRDIERDDADRRHPGLDLSSRRSAAVGRRPRGGGLAGEAARSKGGLGWQSLPRVWGCVRGGACPAESGPFVRADSGYWKARRTRSSAG